MEVYSDDDLEIIEYLQFQRRPHIYRARPQYFEDYDEIDFMARFRLSKDAVLRLLHIIEERLQTPTNRNGALSPMKQLLLTLRYYALGARLTSVGDYCGVSKVTASRIIRRVTRAIAALRPQFIKMPENEDARRQTSFNFFGIARFPRVVGTLDCTHIRIKSPGGPNAEYYRCRKGYMSINVQTVSDANLLMCDIVARWPGSTHDQTILNNSNLRARFEMGEFGTGLLLADSGYENLPFLVTPLNVVQNRAENLYNESLVRTRNTVERQLWCLEAKISCSDAGNYPEKLDTTLAVIVATAVLHNIARTMNLPEPPQDPDFQHPAPEMNDNENNPANIGNDGTRRQIIEDYFTTL